MTDLELCERIAQALLSVEGIEGVELLQTKLVYRDEQGPAIIHFNPDTWRNYGYKGKMRVLVSRPDKQGVMRDKFYKVVETCLYGRSHKGNCCACHMPYGCCAR